MKIVVNLFKMNIRDKYLGSRIGMLWSFINPLMLFCIYIYVFGFVFNSKIPGSEKSLSFVIWLISGYAPWLAISEAHFASASSVVSGKSMVKNIVFKTELLPIAAAMSGIFPLIVGIVLLLPLLLIEGSGISLYLLWLILLIPILVYFLAGVGFFLSSLTVFFRDITQILNSVLMLILFFTPVFYPIEAMPTIIRILNSVNPYYYLVRSFREVMLYRHSPSAIALLFLLLLSTLLWYVGLKLFRRLKGYFVSYL